MVTLRPGNSQEAGDCLQFLDDVHHRLVVVTRLLGDGGNSRPGLPALIDVQANAHEHGQLCALELSEHGLPEPVTKLHEPGTLGGMQGPVLRFDQDGCGRLVGHDWVAMQQG